MPLVHRFIKVGAAIDRKLHKSIQGDRICCSLGRHGFKMNLDSLTKINKEEKGMKQNEYGLPDKMINGLGGCSTQLYQNHPLEKILQRPTISQDAQLKSLRSNQGLHAPLKLMMERNAVMQIQRLPCLTSSHIALETLLGHDEEIGFEDYFDQDPEELVHPQIAMEKKFGF